MFEEALRGQPGVQVLGFAEPSRSVSDVTRQATGLPVLSSHQALLDELNPEAVIVATPDFAHRDAAVDAGRAGKHLLIEKPLADNADDLDAIMAAVSEGGGRCMVGFENRWNPHFVSMKALVDAGELGAAVTLSANLSNTCFVPTSMLSWAARSSPIWFLMPHTIDLARHLTRQEPIRVHAIGSRGLLAARGVDTWDVVHALITMTSGVTVALTSAWILPEAGDSIIDFTLTLVGSTGSARAEISRQGLTTTTDKQRAGFPFGGTIGRSKIGAAPLMAQDFAQSLIDGRPFRAGLADGVAASRVALAIEESLRSGQPADITPTLEIS